MSSGKWRTKMDSGVTVLTLAAIPVGIVSFVCAIIIAINAFQSGVAKGLLCLFCGIYTIIYGITEFDHEKKNIILPTYLICVLVGVAIRVFLAISTGGATR
jgi:uncharacterized membrane protein